MSRKRKEVEALLRLPGDDISIGWPCKVRLMDTKTNFKQLTVSISVLPI